MSKNSVFRPGRAFLVTGVALGVSVASLFAQAPNTSAENLDGRWAATITKDGVAVPFRLDISGNGTNVVGKLYNGSEDYETTTSASFDNGTLQLNFLHYLTSITAQVNYWIAVDPAV